MAKNGSGIKFPKKKLKARKINKNSTAPKRQGIGFKQCKQFYTAGSQKGAT